MILGKMPSKNMGMPFGILFAFLAIFACALRVEEEYRVKQLASTQLASTIQAVKEKEPIRCQCGYVYKGTQVHKEVPSPDGKGQTIQLFYDNKKMGSGGYSQVNIFF